jgi:hypothetical protein
MLACRSANKPNSTRLVCRTITITDCRRHRALETKPAIHEAGALDNEARRGSSVQRLGSVMFSSISRTDTHHHHNLYGIANPIGHRIIADYLYLPSPLALVGVGKISRYMGLVSQRADKVHDPSALLARPGTISRRSK